jgi:hypothetical protein
MKRREIDLSRRPVQRFGSVNPLLRNSFSRTGMVAAVLPALHCSIAVRS